MLLEIYQIYSSACHTSSYYSLQATFACHDVVDRKYETVILPVYGVSTPFHISTIKVFIVSYCDHSRAVILWSL